MQTYNLVIRAGTTADAERIADFSQQTFYETFAQYNTPENMQMFLAQQFTREKLMNEVGMPGNYFFLAYEGDDMVGYLKLREGEQPTGLEYTKSIEIGRIYAATNAIGKGVGKLLMHTAIDTARSMQKEVIWLGVWEHNQRAIDFYTKWGFEKFGTHVFLLGYDVQTDWLMKKVI